jgi:hypothetical protein
LYDMNGSRRSGGDGVFHRGKHGGLIRLHAEGFEVSGQLSTGLITIIRVLGKSAVDNGLDLRRNARDGRRRFVDELIEDGHRGIAIEGRTPRQHLIEHHTQRVDIGAIVQRGTAGLLRRHIFRRAGDSAKAGLVGGAGNAHETEIGDHGIKPAQAWLAAGQGFICGTVQHDIAGLDIAMNDSQPVCIIDGCRRPSQKLRDLVITETRTARMQVPQVDCQRGAVEVFHHNIGITFSGIEIIDLDNIGVPEASHHLGLALQAIAQARILVDKAMQDLDGDRPVEREVRAHIDLCHSPMGEKLVDPDITNNFTDPLSHV